MNLPADGFILLSVVNTKLRDEYPSLQDFCDGEDIAVEEILSKLSALGYEYAPEYNAFKRV